MRVTNYSIRQFFRKHKFATVVIAVAIFAAVILAVVLISKGNADSNEGAAKQTEDKQNQSDDSKLLDGAQKNINNIEENFIAVKRVVDKTTSIEICVDTQANKAIIYENGIKSDYDVTFIDVPWAEAKSLGSEEVLKKLHTIKLDELKQLTTGIYAANETQQLEYIGNLLNDGYEIALKIETAQYIDVYMQKGNEVLRVVLSNSGLGVSVYENELALATQYY